jgi:hypothetical protein
MMRIELLPFTLHHLRLSHLTRHLLHQKAKKKRKRTVVRVKSARTRKR